MFIMIFNSHSCKSVQCTCFRFPFTIFQSFLIIIILQTKCQYVVVNYMYQQDFICFTNRPASFLSYCLLFNHIQNNFIIFSLANFSWVVLLEYQLSLGCEPKHFFDSPLQSKKLFCNRADRQPTRVSHI